MAKNEIKYLTAIKSDKRIKKFCRFKKYGIGKRDQVTFFVGNPTV